MKRSLVALTVAALLAAAGCSSSTSTSPSTSSPSSITAGSTTTAASGTTSPGTSGTYRADVWADNWFALYVDGQLVGEDSVPITTERSFNAESFTFTATEPFTIAMVTKDYMEDESGLEYIGAPNQQIGDGGFVAQFTEVATGRVVAVTDGSWRGLVVQTAPLDPSCEKAADPATACTSRSVAEPAGWAEPAFDDSGWTLATTYTAEQVGTKGGYDEVTWDPAAQLIWSSDLELDNIVLWRARG